MRIETNVATQPWTRIPFFKAGEAANFARLTPSTGFRFEQNAL
jgi:hypothetical protein